MSPPSTGSNSGCDLEDLRLGDSATMNKEVLSDSATATTTTNAPFTSMVSPPSTGSNSGSDLEDLGLGDSATADPGINSSALQDDVSTAQDLMCHSGSPLSLQQPPWLESLLCSFLHNHINQK